jgi:cyclophilin family peptidyl-prolyl cis-trans isomerase
VNNFLRYVDDGFYVGTIFHRVIADFVVQGGGFDADLEEKETRSPIRNEADNGLKNHRAAIAMARTTEYDSATSQFYINLVDNDSLDYTGPGTGYAVFGRVTAGMDIVDEIAAVETETQNGMSDVPVTNVLLHRVNRIPSGNDGVITDSD